LTRATGPDSLLVIVPAFNEEGAIAGVVRSVHRHIARVPVLVIDDGSRDCTHLVAGRSMSARRLAQL
jgi:hypothetical protein